jgi:hypothetical protein
MGFLVSTSGNPYCPNLAALGQIGINYVATASSMPSDSFPGLAAIVTGGSPKTTGLYYDVAYDRSLAPPVSTTGTGLAGGTCTPYAAPTGTTTDYDQGIELDDTKLNGDAPGAAVTEGSAASIDPNKLVRNPAAGCAPVYPWDFIRTNTIFSVVHAAGGYTAWIDKHASYSFVAGRAAWAWMTIIRQKWTPTWCRCRQQRHDQPVLWFREHGCGLPGHDRVWNTPKMLLIFLFSLNSVVI